MTITSVRGHEPLFVDPSTLPLPHRYDRRVSRAWSFAAINERAVTFADLHQVYVVPVRERDGAVVLWPFPDHARAAAHRDVLNANGRQPLVDVTSPTPVGPWVVEVGNQYGTRALGYPSRDRARKAAAEWREQGFTVGPVRRTS